MKLTILGCGPSGGVPLIGCECATCLSDNPRNKRSRASILLEEGDTRLLVDASPDLRTQALLHRFKSIDGVIFTHEHADHMHGIDDLKAFNFHGQAAIPCYGDAATMGGLQDRFRYAMARPDAVRFGHKPALKPHVIEAYQCVDVGCLRVMTFAQLHGQMPTLGLRVGNIAYSTDVNNLPEKSLQALESLDVWVVDCLQIEPAPTHAHLDMTLHWIEQLKPKLAVLTHMSHVLEYTALKRFIPANVVPAYDGMIIKTEGSHGRFSY